MVTFAPGVAPVDLVDVAALACIPSTHLDSILHIVLPRDAAQRENLGAPHGAGGLRVSPEKYNVPLVADAVNSVTGGIDGDGLGCIVIGVSG